MRRRDMCMCMCMCMCIHIHICRILKKWLNKPLFTIIYMCIHIYTYTYIYTYTHIAFSLRTSRNEITFYTIVLSRMIAYRFFKPAGSVFARSQPKTFSEGSVEMRNRMEPYFTADLRLPNHQSQKAASLQRPGVYSARPV